MERAQKRIGSSLQAAVEIFVSEGDAMILAGLDLAEIFITSAGAVHVGAPPEDSFMLPETPDVGVRVSLAPGDKCQRCWKVLPEVGGSAAHPDLCQRCAAAVDALAAAGNA